MKNMKLSPSETTMSKSKMPERTGIENVRAMDRCSVSSDEDAVLRLKEEAERRFTRDPDRYFNAFHFLQDAGHGEGLCIVTVEVCTDEFPDIWEALDALVNVLSADLAIWEESPMTGIPRHWLTVEYPDGRMVDHAADVTCGASGPQLGSWRVIAEGNALDGARRPILPSNLSRAREKGVW